MKKMKKMLVAVVVTMAMMCMMLTGCGQKVPAADETMSALFELYAKENTAPMKDLLGFASDEDVINAYFEEGAIVDYAEEMAAEFTNLGLEVAEEDVPVEVPVFVEVPVLVVVPAGLFMVIVPSL